MILHQLFEDSGIGTYSSCPSIARIYLDIAFLPYMSAYTYWWNRSIDSSFYSLSRRMKKDIDNKWRGDYHHVLFYPSHLSESEWAQLDFLLPRARQCGHSWKSDNDWLSIEHFLCSVAVATSICFYKILHPEPISIIGPISSAFGTGCGRPWSALGEVYSDIDKESWLSQMTVARFTCRQIRLSST